VTGDIVNLCSFSGPSFLKFDHWNDHTEPRNVETIRNEGMDAHVIKITDD